MILIAPDKFKGTYTSAAMCELMAAAVNRANPAARSILRPMSDGGEGFAEMWHAAGRSGTIVESSSLVGFASFDKELPLMRRSSYALGAAIRPDTPTLLTIGGTAVSDGGAGFLQGLGVRFFDDSGRLIDEPLTPDSLPLIASADTSALAAYRLTGIVDVKASLVGPGLSALDFARQKALPGEDLSRLPAALIHLQKILGGRSDFDGAGGGIGYALASVIGARCVNGAGLAVELIEPLLDSGCVSLVITGEGCVDRQTVEGGKLPDAVYRAASAREIPTLVVGGRIEAKDAYPLMCKLTELDICLKKLLSAQ
ncbi:MAG: glycerate kinase [Muribaculaceae bacterium]|nr:glycerate kinase [Muribaculaceae bacterium]